MDDNVMFFRCFMAGCTVLAIGIASCGAYNAYNSEVMARMVEAGASPLEAKCAFSASSSDAMCTALGIKGKDAPR